MDAIEQIKCLICQIPKQNYHNNLGKPICSDCWKGGLKLKTKISPEINQIEENLYLGNADAQTDKEKLKNIGITHIVVVGKELEILHPFDFKYLHIKINDFPFEDLSPFFEEVFKFIDGATKTFIHCLQGKSRSASYVIAYLMRKTGQSFEEAFSLVSQKRNIQPNPGFINQLKQFK